MKIPKNLDLWLAVDKRLVITPLKTEIKDLLFIFYTKPKKTFNVDIYTKIMFDININKGSYDKLFSAKSLGLINDYNPHKLYFLKKRHKKSTRTFWLSLVGYNKYLLTDSYPIKLDNQLTDTIYIQAKNNPMIVYINKSNCSMLEFVMYEDVCKNCSKYDYCHNLYLKHSISYEKIYLYFIKDNKKVYL